MIRLILISIFIYLFNISTVYAYACSDSSGTVLRSNSGGGTSNVYVNLTPEVGYQQNLIVDISKSISCWNTWPSVRYDYASVLSGSTFGSALANFTGVLEYSGNRYAFPLRSSTQRIMIPGYTTPWPAKLYLTPINIASVDGVLIKKGEHFATLQMYQYGTNHDGSAPQSATFTWRFIANNQVVIPTGGCDVSARDIIETIPPYPASKNFNVSIHCVVPQDIVFSISGLTDANGSASTFKNLLTGTNAAQGIGIELLHNGQPIVPETPISLGKVGTSRVDLGLSARYSLTSETLTAGKVQSVVGISFSYE